MEIDYISIGGRIAALRRKNNLTQAKLSELAGIEPSNISHIERGATKPSFPTLLKIANSLDVTIDDLVYGNLKKSTCISIKEINDLISDCTDSELIAVVKMIKATKDILRDKAYTRNE